MEGKERSLTPDICRGIAIFLVIWGHVLQQGLQGVAEVSENEIVKFIYSFHMPLFALISGYFFYGSQKKKSGKELVINRAGSLLKVIVIWNTIHYICAFIMEKWTDGAGEFSIGTWWRAVLEGYWFLWAMLFCTITVGVTVKWLKKQFWFVGFLCFVPLVLLSPCRWVILSIYPFFLMGFWYHKRLDDGKNIAPWLKYISFPIFGMTMLFYLTMPAINNSEWSELIKTCLNFVKGTAGLSELADQAGDVFLYYILGVSGSVSIIVLADIIVKKLKNTAIIRIIARLGQYSLQVYILQRVLLELIAGKCYGVLVRIMGQNMVAQNITLFTWLYSMLISLLCTIVIYGIARHVLRGKVGVALFGR